MQRIFSKIVIYIEVWSGLEKKCHIHPAKLDWRDDFFFFGGGGSLEAWGHIRFKHVFLYVCNGSHN